MAREWWLPMNYQEDSAETRAEVRDGCGFTPYYRVREVVPGSVTITREEFVSIWETVNGIYRERGARSMHGLSDIENYLFGHESHADTALPHSTGKSEIPHERGSAKSDAKPTPGDE